MYTPSRAPTLAPFFQLFVFYAVVSQAIDLPNINIPDLDLSNVDLSNIDPSNVDLSNVDLSNVNIAVSVSEPSPSLLPHEYVFPDLVSTSSSADAVQAYPTPSGGNFNDVLPPSTEQSIDTYPMPSGGSFNDVPESIDSSVAPLPETSYTTAAGINGTPTTMIEQPYPVGSGRNPYNNDEPVSSQEAYPVSSGGYQQTGDNLMATEHFSEEPAASLFTERRNPQCSQSSSAWDNQFLTETLTAPPMEPSFQNNPFLAEHFPLRTDPVTFKGNPTTTNPHDCCGVCSVRWFEVTLHYWPHPDANTECLNAISTDGFDLGAQLGLFSHGDKRQGLDVADPTVLPGLPDKRTVVHRPIVTPGPVVRRDGFYGNFSGNEGTVTRGTDVFVSPSIYIEIPIIHAQDKCGPVGKRYDNVMWSYQPYDVSTVMPERPDCWPALLGMDPVNAPNCKYKTRQFNFADLPCPPSSLRAEGGSQFIYHTAAEYEPMLMQPWRIGPMDPDWARCSSNIGWDPPGHLTPFGRLGGGRCRGRRCRRDEFGNEFDEEEETMSVAEPIPTAAGQPLRNEFAKRTQSVSGEPLPSPTAEPASSILGTGGMMTVSSGPAAPTADASRSIPPSFTSGNTGETQIAVGAANGSKLRSYGATLALAFGVGALLA